MGRTVLLAWGYATRNPILRIDYSTSFAQVSEHQENAPKHISQRLSVERSVCRMMRSR